MKRLTNKQKQEVVNLYGNDFYYDDIIDFFTNYDYREVKKIHDNVLRRYKISKKDWKAIVQEANEWGVEGGDWYETIGLTTMYTLLKKYNVDLDKTYCNAK